MTPEEVARRKLKEYEGIDFKKFNNIYPLNNKKRPIERNGKKAEKIRTSKESSKIVAVRLQKKLIQRGKIPNLDSNFFAFVNV